MSTPTPRSLFCRLAVLALLAGGGTAAQAQDYMAMIQQSMNRMDQIVNQAQQAGDAAVRQRMQDPQVQQAYQQYRMQMQASGQQPMDFYRFTYEYIYTNGFSRDGIAHRARVENGNRAAEMNAVRGMREAEQNRANAMQAQRDGYSRNQQEAGRQLGGNSSFHAQNGTSTVLPHTWQSNTTHVYQGNTYHVDPSGQYYVQGTDGWWYPLNR